jgi:hypothetical protein
MGLLVLVLLNPVQLSLKDEATAVEGTRLARKAAGLEGLGAGDQLEFEIETTAPADPARCGCAGACRYAS